MSDSEEPTSVRIVLDNFRKDMQNAHKSSILFPNTLSTMKPRRLLDESENYKAAIPEKRTKFETPPGKDLGGEVMSPWEIRRIKSEVLKNRSELLAAEERINALQNMKIATEQLYSSEKRELEERLNQERSRVKELEERIDFIRKREAEYIERCTKLKFGERSKEIESIKIIAELQTENNNLKEAVFNLENELNSVRNHEETVTAALKLQIESLVEKDERNINILKELRNEVLEKRNDLRKLELEQAKLLIVTKRVKDLEMERETYLETKAHVEAQNKKLMQFNTLEKEIREVKEENKRLRSSISNTLYLETVVDDLQTRQKLMDKLQQELVKVQTENDNQRHELDNLRDLAKHYCLEDENSSMKPSQMLQKRLEELVKKELWYASENKELELKCSNLKNNLEQLEAELLKTKENANCLKSSCETHASNIRRLKRQLNLITWERNDLRSLLDSYQKETTVVVSESTNNQMDILQKVIDGYKERTKKLESDPSIIAINDADCKPYTALECNQLKAENKKLSEKVQQLSDQLEYRNLKGDFDPRNIKVIHQKSNPFAEATENYEAKLTKANEEICKLKERIKVMEDGHVQDITRITEERVQTSSTKEANDLREQLKSLETKHQRFCEVFKKKSHEFRDAIYMLFGYKVDCLPNNRYRLSCTYAFSPQDFLLFQISETTNGVMQMLETPFSETLTELIDLHLNQQNSIPAFLSSLTIDLFNKQTFISTSSAEVTQS